MQQRTRSILGPRIAASLSGLLGPGIVSPILVALTVLAYGVTLYALWIGLDFGFHWDEHWTYFLVVRAHELHTLLPHTYYYPSMLYWVSLASVGDRLFATLISTGGHPFRAPLPFDLDFFIMRARLFSMIVSSLGAWWIFFALRTSRAFNPTLAAFIGAIAYLFSWEFGYHARWLAPDMLAAQFVALFILCLVKADNSDRPGRWLTGAAIAAGLAASTKYSPGALVFVIWFYLLVRRRETGWTLLLTCARLSLVAAAAYLVVTPGTLFYPATVARHVMTDAQHYAIGHSSFDGVFSYDVHDHGLYLVRLWEYLCLAMMSPEPVLAAILAALALWGFVPAWRQSKALASALGFLLAFFSLLFARQAVFIVRNFLVLLPLFAYLIGIGFDALWEWAASKQEVWARYSRMAAVGLAAALVFGWNGWEQLSFGRSIPIALREGPGIEVAQYLRDHPKARIALSQGVRALVLTGVTPPRNVVDFAHADQLVFFHQELNVPSARLADWPATRHHSYDWLGAREVNLNYYPTWAGRDHVMILNMAAARRMGVTAVLQAAAAGPQ